MDSKKDFKNQWHGLFVTLNLKLIAFAFLGETIDYHIYQPWSVFFLFVGVVEWASYTIQRELFLWDRVHFKNKKKRKRILLNICMWKRLPEVDFIDVWMVDDREKRQGKEKWGLHQSFGEEGEMGQIPGSTLPSVLVTRWHCLPRTTLLGDSV